MYWTQQAMQYSKHAKENAQLSTLVHVICAIWDFFHVGINMLSHDPTKQAVFIKTLAIALAP